MVGHQPVNPDWIRLSPISPVNHSQYWEWYLASRMLPRTKMPAMSRDAFSKFIFSILSQNFFGMRNIKGRSKGPQDGFVSVHQ